MWAYKLTKKELMLAKLRKSKLTFFDKNADFK